MRVMQPSTVGMLFRTLWLLGVVYERANRDEVYDYIDRVASL